MNTRVQELIHQLDLAPHPEGGFYKEVFRSQATIEIESKTRQALTSIYFLLPKGEVSRWHVVKSDEVWIHVEGDPLELAIYKENPTSSEVHVLGNPKAQPLKYQATVARNDWQAARSLGEYSLVSCVVGPGFDFEDFTMMEKEDPRAKAWADTFPYLKAYA